MPSCLVTKEYPKHKMKHKLESFNPRDLFNDYLPEIESEEGPVRSTKLFLQSLRNAKAESIAEASSFSFGASRKQEQEECEPEVIKVLEMLKENAPKYIVDSYPEDLQTSGVLAERFMHEGTSGINERK
jgi:hypothetical protein